MEELTLLQGLPLCTVEGKGNDLYATENLPALAKGLDCKFL